MRVGSGARLHRCIVDKNVDVPPWYRIGLDGMDADNAFTVSPAGITVIAKDQKLT